MHLFVCVHRVAEPQRRFLTMTKKQEEIFERFLKSEMVDIYDAYERPSREKVRIFLQCKLMCAQANNGHRPRIVTRNKFMFTFGYIFTREETQGTFQYFKYITKDGSYTWCLE